uniref:Uncharacterized protein n=1 Tax=Parascaris univalens TaxID=6257 RepID=A0A915B280_PARUN
MHSIECWLLESRLEKVHCQKYIGVSYNMTFNDGAINRFNWCFKGRFPLDVEVDVEISSKAYI